MKKIIRLLLRSHQAPQRGFAAGCNSGRVRDQPGLPVPEASFIVNMYVRMKRTSKFMPPQKQICTSEL